MSTSDRTMSQVRAILQRLDRSIDQAREKRTQPVAAPSAPAQVSAAPAPQPAPAPSASASAIGPSAAPAQPARPSSPFGRAQPLNRAPQQQLRWGS
jgi:hypothetical protein